MVRWSSRLDELKEHSMTEDACNGGSLSGWQPARRYGHAPSPVAPARTKEGRFETMLRKLAKATKGGK
jgi:hypothetical protein